MEEISLLIGGKAGFGIDKSSAVLGSLLNKLGYYVYIYRDYPSLIRGGHTFSIIRASKNRIAAHQGKVDLVLALNQETLELHRGRLKKDCFFIFDAEQVNPVKEIFSNGSKNNCGLGLSLGKLLKEENAPEIMRNTCIIGALTKAIGVNFDILKETLKKGLAKDIDLNIKVALRGFNAAKELIKIPPLSRQSLPLLSGNQAIALGLIQAGLEAYIAYPMTPSSPILHYLAEIADEFSLTVIHPESEIAAICMALGYSYAGKKVAVGTSGGGFCLMTEGLSLSAMAELAVVIVLGQRPGPSTGLPTYSAQTDLHFALNAGQGEFTRFLVAPGDAEEAYFWSAFALKISANYQIPSIILSDKDLGESVFNFDPQAVGEINNGQDTQFLWDKNSAYKRYLITENGISPLAFPPLKDAIIKVNSYEHDEFGITTEEPQQTKLMQDKRLRKEKFLAEELENIQTVKVYGGETTDIALLCWGSNKGVCLEVSQRLGLKLIQPVVLNPFSIGQFQQALSGVKKLILVENNATGQLLRLIKEYGFSVNAAIFKYDGRPFSLEELEEKVKKLIK